MKPLVLLSPTAILGYGFPVASLERGLSFGPDVIAVDAGSTDPGPFYLGSGKSFVPRKAVKRDLGFLLRAARALRVPLLIGSAGGSGARPHLDWCREILLETAAEEGLSFRLAVIAADVSKQYLDDALRAGPGQTARPCAGTDCRGNPGQYLPGCPDGGRPPDRSAGRRERMWCWPGAAMTRRYSPPCRSGPAIPRGWPCTWARSWNVLPSLRHLGAAATA